MLSYKTRKMVVKCFTQMSIYENELSSMLVSSDTEPTKLIFAKSLEFDNIDNYILFDTFIYYKY